MNSIMPNEDIGAVVMAVSHNKTIQLKQGDDWCDCDFSGIEGSKILFVVSSIDEGGIFRVKPESITRERKQEIYRVGFFYMFDPPDITIKARKISDAPACFGFKCFEFEDRLRSIYPVNGRCTSTSPTVVPKWVIFEDKI